MILEIKLVERMADHMTLRKKGEWWYGDSQSDIQVELGRYGELNGYVPAQFADAKCECGGQLFRLALDDEAGAAVRNCSICNTEHPIGDSDEYLSEATLQTVICVCDNEVFEVTVGVSLYDDSDDVRWLYVGCRCPECGLTGCYGDWKNEFSDYRELLKRV